MELSLYPRPKKDSRLGIHGGANAWFPMGEVDDFITSFWIPELLAMGFSWVKLLNVEGSAYVSVEKLVGAGIEPVVRLYRNEPNPGTLDLEPKLKASVPELVKRGVHYFETNNEPNLSVEWKNGSIPTYGPEQVAKDFLVDASYIISCGGIPLIPAMAPGGNWDDMDFLQKMLEWFVRNGKLDVLDKCAIACHNAALNHPIDYPYDAINQLGSPVSQEEYDREQWLMTRDGINSTRMANKNPGQTLLDPGASNCWLKYQAVHDLTKFITGLDLPVISTEGGFWRDNRADNRYPTLTLWGITSRVMEVAEQMAKSAPPWYLTTGFWILSNKGMGNPVASGFENDAWYSYTLDNGHLPVVEELKKRGFVQASYNIIPPIVIPPIVIPIQLTDTEIAFYNKQGGFTGDGLVISIAVVLAESGGVTGAVGDIGIPGPGHQSNGLFQFNTYWHPEVTQEMAFNPRQAAIEAFRVSDGGTNWSQWSTFKEGTYLKYLDRAIIAATLVSTQTALTTDQLRNIKWNSLGIAYNKDFAFPRFAEANDLGLPRSNEVRFDADGIKDDGEYVGQTFDGGFLWCKVGDYGNIFWFVD